jgi:hypothetical protein
MPSSESLVILGPERRAPGIKAEVQGRSRISTFVLRARTKQRYHSGQRDRELQPFQLRRKAQMKSGGDRKIARLRGTPLSELSVSRGFPSYSVVGRIAPYFESAWQGVLEHPQKLPHSRYAVKVQSEWKTSI